MNMFLRSMKFCYNRNLLNQTLFRYISYTTLKTSNKEILYFSQNNKTDIANTQRSNEEKSKLICGGKYITDRTYSTHSSPTIRIPRNMASKDETEEFMTLFPVIVSDLVEYSNRLGYPELSKHLETVLQYNLQNGKKLRGLGLVVAYKMMQSSEKLTSENIRLANILGWCVELLQSFILILDDIVDNSEIRRGYPCWYKVQGVGLQALNDCIIIENGAYLILQKYFANHPNYVKMLEEFHDATFKTHIGQCSDIMCMTEGKLNYEFFTMETFKTTTKLKTSYFLTYLPITLAMRLSHKYDEDMYLQVKDILLELGEFYQIQNDYLDCFGNPESNGKNSNDICEGKFTWLAVIALQRGNRKQIETFKEHYGKGNNKDSERIVRGLYEELGLPRIYATYEKESFDLIRTRIQQTSKELPHELLLKFTENILKFSRNFHLQAKEILLEMGEYYQIQNDALDCFGNLETNRKNANDICEGKCTWLAVVALQRGSPEQINTFKEHYGRGNNDESEQIVRNLYEELELPLIYATYEKESFNLIRTRIQLTSKELPHKLLLKFIDNMYGR